MGPVLKLYSILLLVMSAQSLAKEREDSPFARVECDSVPIRFYAKKDMSSKPILELTTKGLFKGKEKICWWTNSNADGSCTGGSNLKCFSWFPFYTFDSTESRILIKSEKGPIAEIEYEGHPYFFDVSKNKNIYISKSPASLKKEERQRVELFLKENPEFSRFRLSFAKCLKGTEIKCMENFIELPFHANISICNFDSNWPIISTLKNLRKCLKDIKYFILPCLQEDAAHFVNVQDSRVDIKDNDNYTCTFYKGSDAKKTWKLEMFSEQD